MRTRRSVGLLLTMVLLTSMLVAIAAAPAGAAIPADDDLLLTEIAVTPSAGEFVEIFNAGTASVDLSDVYLTDATFRGGGTYYFNIVAGSNAGGGGFADWHARFPDGATIAPGEYQTVALAGSESHFATYGADPTYEMCEDGAGPDGVPDMREALPGAINCEGNTPGLSNSGEVVILYAWDGQSDLVQDLDYALWGDKAEYVDKTGVSIDGPDADAAASDYLPDAGEAEQDIVFPGSHVSGDSFQRIDLTEGTEPQSGGNGIAGANEMRENLSATWSVLAATPGAEVPLALVVNEIMQNPSAVLDGSGEWFEIFNAGDFPIDLDGWVIRDEGSDGHEITGTLVVPAGGFAVLGINADSATNGGVAVDYQYADFFLGNGEDEVVLVDPLGTVVDRVEYDNGATFPDPTGASMALRAPDLDNNDGANWCTAATAMPGGDLGTPGGPNDCTAPPSEVCDEPFTPAYTIQGTGLDSPFDGQVHAVEGVVVGDFQTERDGFFIQDATGDGVATTSDGLFVYAPGTIDVVMGDRVRAVGTVDEFFGLTELTNVSALAVCGPGTIPAVTEIPLPYASIDDLEPYEGMLVTVDDPTATDLFDFGRYGEVMVSPGDRLLIPTDVMVPGPDAFAQGDENGRSQLRLDDVSDDQNPTMLRYLGDGVPRLGQRVENLTAVLGYSFSEYRLYPTDEPVFTGNPRPDGPDDVGGVIQVASFNVLNYWTTFGGRGADDAVELERQTAKLVPALLGTGAEIIGLQELENNGPDAIGALVDALNAATAPGTWAFVPDPVYPGGLESTNAIKVGIIYQPGAVTPVGDPVADDDPVFATDRPPVAQAFDVGGDVITVVVNHFKSKSSSDATGLDLDQNDGQGAYNFRRTNQAHALVDFVAELAAVDGDVLAIGDFNSYANEDPIGVLDAGLVNLTDGLSDSDRYSFVFFGQAGQLDYAYATEALAGKITGADVWHINADEPKVLDYNTNFGQGDVVGAYQPDEFRSSDHDPVIVGIAMRDAAGIKADVRAALAGLLPTGDKKDDKRLEKALDALDDSLDPELWIDGSALARKGKKVFDEEKKAVKELGKVDNTDVAGLIAQLVHADRMLAEYAIGIAMDTGGDEKEIAKAHKELAKGDTEAGKDKPDKAVDRYRKAWQHAVKAVKDARFATFNVSLNRFNAGDLIEDLSTPGDSQARAVAEIIQRTRPDVILLNEFDYDASGLALDLFQANYLGVSQNGADPIAYAYSFVAPSNTGIPSGFDLNNSGGVGGPNDAFGFGFFPGQYGMAVLSKHPIDLDAARTFQLFRWADMPGALLPTVDGAGEEPYYSAEELEVVRLSSKSHWDLPIQVGDRVVHFLTSHPTPPVFDGPEDRNGLRNHDEIRFWADYVSGADYIYDDDGVYGGLPGGARFVIAGDQNADPYDGDSSFDAIWQLLDHPKVNTKETPSSAGGVADALAEGPPNDTHTGDPAHDTADFGGTGNLRADYVLPSKNLKILGSGVFWPVPEDPFYYLVGSDDDVSSDHRMVWIDVKT